MCLLFLIDILVSFLTPSIDNNTNTYATTWRRKSILFLSSWDAVRVIGSIPMALFPISFVRYWYISRIVHISEIYNLVSSLKMERYGRINRALKWARIILLTFFFIHVVGCIFYFIAILNPDRSTAWFSVGDEELEKERDQSFFRYIMAIYWSTTVFTTVGYGDYHAINGTEMTFNVIFMLFYMVINSYLSSCISELLEDCQTANELKQNCEALRRFVNAHQLSDELHQQMYEYLGRCSSKSFSIQMFSNNIQLKVKQALSEKVAYSHLFNDVSPTLLQLLVAEMELETFEANEIILPADDYSKKLYVLVQGGIVGLGLRISSLSVCGEFGVICGLPQPCDVRSITTSTLFSLQRNKFHELMQTNKLDGDTIASNILKNLKEQADDAILNPVLNQLHGKFNGGEVRFYLSLKFACRMAYPKLLRYLIKSGEDLDEVYEHNRNILHILLAEWKQGSEDCLKILLAEMTLDKINQRDSFEHPPLCYAIDKRNQVMLNAFLLRKVPLPSDKVSDYYLKAVEEDDFDLVALIHRLGGNVNVTDTLMNQTPLHSAVMRNSVDMVTYLLRLGANKTLPDAYGMSPMQMAATCNYVDIVNIFEDE